MVRNLCISFDNVVYLYDVSQKISQMISELLSKYYFHIKKKKKRSIIPLNDGEIMVFNLITLSHNAFYLYQVSQKYLKGFQTY